MAVHRDPLTGLIVGFAENAVPTAWLAAAQAHGLDATAACVGLANIEDLRMYNHVVDFEAGDAILSEMGSRLVAAAGSASVCARIGGSEFAIVSVRDLGATRALLEGLGGLYSVAGRHVDVRVWVGAAAWDVLSDDGWMAALAAASDDARTTRRNSCSEPYADRVSAAYARLREQLGL